MFKRLLPVPYGTTVLFHSMSIMLWTSLKRYIIYRVYVWFGIFLLQKSENVEAFVHRSFSSGLASISSFSSSRSLSRLSDKKGDDIFYDDFDFFDDDDDEDSLAFARLSETKTIRDLSGSQHRQFRLGNDVMVVDFIGSLGFEEVTDWEYYYDSEDDDGERQVVKPPPMDSSKPRRTRSSSGSLVCQLLWLHLSTPVKY